MSLILHSHALVNNLENDDDDDSNSYIPNYVNVAILLLTKKEFFKNKDLSSMKRGNFGDRRLTSTPLSSPGQEAHKNSFQRTPWPLAL